MIYQEVDINQSLTDELDKIIRKLGYSKEICNLADYDEKTTQEYCQKRVTKEALDKILQGHDRNVATADENVVRLPPDFVKKSAIPAMFEKLVKDVCKVDRKYIYHITGKFWYPSNGYMGWHTNNSYPGFRFYCSHAEEEGKSFFRFQHPETKEIITSWDRKGWIGRVFAIDTAKPLWHCVYSETNRISVGCNMMVER
jgi:hypothetical protein